MRTKYGFAESRISATSKTRRPFKFGSICARCICSDNTLESHAERVYGAAIDDSVNGAKTILRRVKAGDIGPAFTRQELQQKKWSGLTDVQAVVEATERLEAHNYLRIKKVETGGRPSYACTLNPKALGK